MVESSGPSKGPDHRVAGSGQTPTRRVPYSRPAPTPAPKNPQNSPCQGSIGETHAKNHENRLPQPPRPAGLGGRLTPYIKSPIGGGTHPAHEPPRAAIGFLARALSTAPDNTSSPQKLPPPPQMAFVNAANVTIWTPQQDLLARNSPGRAGRPTPQNLHGKLHGRLTNGP